MVGTAGQALEDHADARDVRGVHEGKQDTAGRGYVDNYMIAVSYDYYA